MGKRSGIRPKTGDRAMDWIKKYDAYRRRRAAVVDESIECNLRQLARHIAEASALEGSHEKSGVAAIDSLRAIVSAAADIPNTASRRVSLRIGSLRSASYASVNPLPHLILFTFVLFRPVLYWTREKGLQCDSVAAD